MNETTETVTLLPTVRIWRTRFFEADVWEGDFPRDDTRSEDFDFDPQTETDEEIIDGAVRVFQREGLTFSATGTDWAGNPNGTRIIDYGTAQREETSGHLIGFTDAQVAAIIEQVG
jgi:hypothetical protein